MSFLKTWEEPLMATALITYCKEKSQRTLEEGRAQMVKMDAARKNITYRWITYRWYQNQIHRASPTAEGRTWRDVVLLEDIAVTEDKSNGPRNTRSNTEGATSWSCSEIVNPDNSEQATKR